MSLSNQNIHHRVPTSRKRQQQQQQQQPIYIHHSIRPTMSLINPIKVKRVNLAYSQNSPIEWSDNLQLSLNLYTDLTVLDPKLPDYHLIITDKDDKTVLDAKELFSETILLHHESISLLPLGDLIKSLLLILMKD